MTRYSATGSKKDAKNAIKDVVSTMGLPAEHFSTKSLQSGFGTHAVANGMSTNDMNVRGG